MASNNLWAPWRIEYIKGLAEEGLPAKDEASSGCFLCDAAVAEHDVWEDRLVLLCDERGVLMLNRFPYTNGHLLAAPSEHKPDLVSLSETQRAGLIELANLGGKLLNDAMNPQGLNIGINIGRCAGAGLPGHVHMHIVPRWQGDVNFMQTVGEVRVIPQALEASYQALREVLGNR